MTSFDFDVIGDTPRLVSRPPDGAKPATTISAPAIREQPPAVPVNTAPPMESVSMQLEKRRA
jgi:hypothetical protein